MNFIPEEIKRWHEGLSHKAKLLYYGVLGNLSLTALDVAASIMGGHGSAINGLHNAGDIAAYGLRGLATSEDIEQTTSRCLLFGANLLALSLTGWLTARSGLELLENSRHTLEPGAAYLETASSLGNFVIAAGLKEQDSDPEGCAHTQDDHALSDGHHHAKTDAWAGLFGATGLALAVTTGDSRLDSLGALAGGTYFLLHMLQHMRNKNSNVHHHH